MKLADLEFESGEIVIAVGTMDGCRGARPGPRCPQGSLLPWPEARRPEPGAHGLRFPHGDAHRLGHACRETQRAQRRGGGSGYLERSGPEGILHRGKSQGRTRRYLHHLSVDQEPRDRFRELLQKSRERFPSTPWHMFGPSPRPEQLEQGTYKRLPSIPEARAIYNRCKVWILPSRTEGFSGSDYGGDGLRMRGRQHGDRRRAAR